MSRPGTATAGRTGATGCGRDCPGSFLARRSSGMSNAVKTVERWFSGRLQQEITVVRWGTLGRPVLIFPSAGGDAEEIERYGLVEACGPLLADDRVKLYSTDSVAGRAMDVIAGGASIGAFNAVAVLCRYPDIFSAAIGMSGSYRIERFYDEASSQDLYFSAPLQFLPGLDGPQLDRLRGRFAVLASGDGRWENVGESWQMASALGAKGIPNRVGNWGAEWDHEWTTWRAMLPQYLAELT